MKQFEIENHSTWFFWNVFQNNNFENLYKFVFASFVSLCIVLEFFYIEWKTFGG